MSSIDVAVSYFGESGLRENRMAIFKFNHNSTMSYYRGKDKLLHKADSLAEEIEFNSSLEIKLNRNIDWSYIAAVSLAWISAVHYFERVVVQKAIHKCKWSNWEDWSEKETQANDPHRILLIADPQIVDRYTYTGIQGKLTWLIKIITDNYARRNYEFLQGILDPHSTIFLGDLFDGGREWEDDEWFEEYKRFNGIFKPRVNRRFVNSIPGNHDIGYETIDYEKVKRFTAHFGDLNQFIELGNHSIVMLDTISLSHPDPQINRESKEFLDLVNKYLNPEFPRILLMHVPFYRFTHEQLCGPLREKGDPFPVQKGKQYQTVTEYPISQDVLIKLYPEIIFAGDDHDYCDIIQLYPHNNGYKNAREIAVKSFAMNGGIHQPAAQLLSLNNPGNNPGSSTSETYQTEMCLMPLPYRPLKVYSLILLVSVGYLIVKHLYQKKVKALIAKANIEIPQWRIPKREQPVNYQNFILHVIYAFIFPIVLLNIYYSMV